MDKKEYTARENQLIIINQKEKHRVIRIGKDGCTYATIFSISKGGEKVICND